ncbi:hypothetical protein B0H67DRAFT_500785, partial [Lasiosphaeris hirsuta]
LTLAYWSQGRWKEAEGLETTEYDICSRVLGEKHPNTLTSMANLASTWKSLCRLKEALHLIRRCVEFQQQILDPDHPYTVSTFSRLRQWEAASRPSNDETTSISE